MSLFGKIFRFITEWDARGKDYPDLLARLQKNEEKSLPRFANAPDAPGNRARASHIIGIENWGQSRLRVLLGKPLVMDEYDGYAPSTDLTTAELAKEFEKTRATTKEIVRELQAKGVSPTATVKHNEIGDISAAGWVVYISAHTGRETNLLR
jgi:hypothetical protein